MKTNDEEKNEINSKLLIRESNFRDKKNPHPNDLILPLF
jgi:hypothetical protein